MYNLTLPRVLTLRQGHIFSRPAAELKALRIESSAIDIDADMESKVSRACSTARRSSWTSRWARHRRSR